MELGTQQLGRIILTEVKIMHSLFSDLWNKFFVSTKSNRNKITSPYDQGVLKINTLSVVRDLDTEVNGIITFDNFIFWFVTPPLLHLLHISCVNSFCQKKKKILNPILLIHTATWRHLGSLNFPNQ